MNRLLEASVDDFDNYYKLKSEPANVHWSGFECPPDRSRLKSYFLSALSDPETEILKLVVDSDFVGYIQVRFCGPLAEISYGISQNYAGKGFGKKLIKQTVDYVFCKDSIQAVEAIISEKNVASVKCVEVNGFFKTNKSEERFLELPKEKHMFYAYKIIRESK